MRLRSILNIITLLSILSLSFALFSQYYWGMLPCAWCVLSRFLLVLLIIFSVLFNFFYNHSIKKIGAFFSLIVSILGIATSYYQYTVANKTFTCELTLADKIISKWLGLDALLPQVFGIKATCMDAVVSLFGLDYVLWALILFVFLTLLSLVGLFSKPKLSNRALFK
ncbi:disulfide bond formation protein B [Taylorella equigenitalis]|uniref:disulfide bond formation protein B n=1 Tax=Taylorella equigenitalis TaxID=29575 RepID=UPI0023B09D14|nr:disulfide bond formation protein B [Taylorella equigenitalis]WEE01135.1 disulfide bond formation protein B [Taylorella equigenitalis]WEE02613.1 disulfide bond formation protein B [Taylorella equigenitalis]WFD79153.1 disulfide bond formation protein B [Taylorella equigenitalis]WFD80626.1 disulfide bond formation protein B [Taylorella equigenitalis]WFD82105.1 disulfide bond formation protein B [Taylorella equigenitalis]